MRTITFRKRTLVAYDVDESSGELVVNILVPSTASRTGRRRLVMSKGTPRWVGDGRRSGSPAPETGRRRRGTADKVAWMTMTLLVILLLVGDVADGVTAHRASAGAGRPGTLVVDGRERIDVGKPPPIYQWAGRFRSDDGQVRRHARMAEPLPVKAAHVGARVRVRWLSSQPDEVYLRRGSRVWTNWLEAQSVFGIAIPVGLVVWLRRRRLHRRGTASA